MKNDPAYLKLKELVSAYKLKQAEELTLTTEQVTSLFADEDEPRKSTITFLKNMKHRLICDKQVETDIENAIFVASQIEGDNRIAMRDRFEPFVLTSGRQDDKPFVTIWLDGTSEAI